MAVTNNPIFQYNNHGINMTSLATRWAGPGQQRHGDWQHGEHAWDSIQRRISTPFTWITALYAGEIISRVAWTSAALEWKQCREWRQGRSPPNNNDIRLRQRQATTVRLPGYGGANNDDAAVVAYLTGRNTLTTPRRRTRCRPAAVSSAVRLVPRLRRCCINSNTRAA